MAAAKRDRAGRDAMPVPEEGKRHKRERTLALINEELAAIGLPPHRKLGDYTQGETELVAIVGKHEFRDRDRSYFWVIVYETIKPNGMSGTYAMLVNSRHAVLEAEDAKVAATGTVCMVTVNNCWAAFVRQHRPTVGGWTTEVPRGYVTQGIPIGSFRLKRRFEPVVADAAALRGCDLPMGIIGTELAPLIAGGVLRVNRLVLLGASPENTGNSTNITPAFWLDLATDDETIVKRVRGTDEMRIVWAPADALLRDWRSVGLDSHHCFSTLWLWHTYRLSLADPA